MSDPLHVPTLLRMARDTVADPRDGAKRLLDLDFPREALWTAFGLVLVLSLLVGGVMEALVGMSEAGGSNLAVGLFQGTMMLAAVFAIDRIGRACGGQGDFDGGLTLVVWLMFILLLVQVAQLLSILLFLPVIALLLGVAGIGLFFWLLTNFVAVLHGFSSLGRVFLGVLGAMLGISFALSLLFTMVGLEPTLLLGF